MRYGSKEPILTANNVANTEILRVPSLGDVAQNKRVCESEQLEWAHKHVSKTGRVWAKTLKQALWAPKQAEYMSQKRQSQNRQGVSQSDRVKIGRVWALQYWSGAKVL